MWNKSLQQSLCAAFCITYHELGFHRELAGLCHGNKKRDCFPCQNRKEATFLLLWMESSERCQLNSNVSIAHSLWHNLTPQWGVLEWWNVRVTFQQLHLHLKYRSPDHVLRSVNFFCRFLLLQKKLWRKYKALSNCAVMLGGKFANFFISWHIRVLLLWTFYLSFHSTAAQVCLSSKCHGPSRKQSSL